MGNGDPLVRGEIRVVGFEDFTGEVVYFTLRCNLS
jgi:hypothetical protein